MTFIKSINAYIKKAIAVIFMIFAQTLFFGCECDIDYEANDANLIIRHEDFDSFYESLDSAIQKINSGTDMAMLDINFNIEYVSKVDMIIEKVSVSFIDDNDVNCKVISSLKGGLYLHKSDEPISTKAKLSLTIKKLEKVNPRLLKKVDVVLKAVIDGKEYDIVMKNATQKEVEKKFEKKFKDLRIGIDL